MANLLTVDEVLEHVDTELGSDAVQRLIDGADAEIIRRLGPLTGAIEVLDGGDRILYLGRKASAVTAAVERFSVEGLGTADYVLVTGDWSLLADGFRVERLDTGTNPSSAWRGQVTITYTPAAAGEAERKMLLVNLVKLDLKYTGHLAVSAGDTRIQSLGTYADERAALFRAFGSGGRRLIT